MVNPFTATFGVTPPLLVGRDGLLAEFREALDDGPGASGRATLYTGARGAGKTVMLNAAEQIARERGWLIISETASPGFVQRITTQHLPKLLREFDPDTVVRRLKNIAIGGGAIAWETAERHVIQSGLRNQVELLTDILRAHNTGLLITLDEVHRNQLEEMRELAVVIQHAFREDRELAFVGAGLALGVDDITNDEVLTFLRRADRYTLGAVEDVDVRQGLREPIEAAGRYISDSPLEVMTRGSAGYPFLLQLVGARTWRLHPDHDQITVTDAEAGVKDARRRLGTLVHAPALRDISGIDKSFLLAMSKDDGPSKMSDIKDRLEADANYVGQYRLRLIAAELIHPTSHGYVDFSLPFLREYLREHAAGEAFS